MPCTLRFLDHPSEEIVDIVATSPVHFIVLLVASNISTGGSKLVRSSSNAAYKDSSLIASRTISLSYSRGGHGSQAFEGHVPLGENLFPAYPTEKSPFLKVRKTKYIIIVSQNEYHCISN